MTGIVRLALLLFLAVPQAREPFNMRPADVTVVMSTSRGKYNGTYRLSQVAKVCGEVPKELNFSGVPAFLVQFPDDAGDGEVQDVTFDSKDLVGKVTSTTKFHLSISLKSPRIGGPEAYVLDPTQPTQPKMTGTATLATSSAGTTTLVVKGVNDRGQAVELTVTCKARSGGRP